MAESNHDYLGSSPGYSVRESTDLDHYRAQPGQWTVDVTQLARGNFGSRIRSVEFPGLIAYHNQWACRALLHGSSPDNWLMIGGMVSPDEASATWCGKRRDRQNFAATGENQEIEFNVEPQANNVVLLMEPTTLIATVGEEATDLLRNTKHLDFEEAGSRLIDTVMDLLALVETNPSVLDTPAIGNQAHSVLLKGVEDCFSILDLSVEEGSGRSRGEIVHQAILHIHQCGSATSAWQAARAVGVSQKTLELAFREVINITPGKYLLMTRLNSAHHALAYANRTDTTVTDIALQLGFTHMGRFAGAYKQLFGENPSDTLYRPPSGA